MTTKEYIQQYIPMFENLYKEDSMLVHAVSFCVDNKGFLIMAPSGVGKSTQFGFWKQILGDKVEVINDDKPILKLLSNGDVLIKSSPISGKERNFSDRTAILKAVCILDGKEDYKVPEIREISKKEALSLIIPQVYIPKTSEGMARTLELIDKMFGTKPIFVLKRNKTTECAQLCINTLLNDEN